jgi:uncharacterized protein YegP (UPF0339 family)
MTHKAFVSSTFEDLKLHRQKVITDLRKAGILVDPMEDWAATNDEPKQFSQDRLKDCDLCVLLVGFRRGTVPKGEKLSITQLEYRAAIALKIDILVFMLDEDAPWPRKFDELEKDPEIRQWRAELKEHWGVGVFGLEPNSIEIAPALTRWLAERNRLEASRQDNYEYLLSLQPDLADLMQECSASDPDKVLGVLREKIISRLKMIASRIGYESKGKPPAELLQQLAEKGAINIETQRTLEYAIGVTSEILYEKKVQKEEAIRAIQETAIGFNSINSKSLELPHFRLVELSSGKWNFGFSINNKVLVHSETYLSRLGVLNGIRSTRRIVESGRIKECKNKNGKYFFSLIAANGQLIGHSLRFENEAAMGLIIKSVKEHLPSAPIIEMPKQ